ncbi:hypothetical protein RV02_GL002077 [Enterococcus gilvus]|nr:hypothetical protein RV02_GL002077 [Enterococcus gilvus]
MFTLIFIVGCIGTWYFIKKKQNKKNRNISIGLIVLSILLMSIFPTSDSKESAKSSDKDTKSSTKISSKNEALALTVPKEVLSNDDGLISIKGNTSPHAEVTIGMGVVGDKTTANKSGDFELSYDMDFQDETTLTINSRLDGNSKSSKVKVKMNETALAKLEQKEAETSKIEESKAAEKKRIKESKEAQNNTMSSSSENNEDSDITKLADGATSGQADILNELALQQFDKSYPYKGSKLHIVLGRIQDWTQKDGKWFAKFDATIVNAFDAERKTNVEVTIEPATASSGYVSFLDY